MDYSKYYKNKGICFVLSGPSGVGKDTVIKKTNHQKDRFFAKNFVL